MPRHTLNFGCLIDQLLDLWVTFIHHFQVWGTFQSFGNGHVQFHWNGFCHLVHLLIIHSQHPADITHTAAGCHRTKGNDLCYPLLAIFADNIIDDFLTTFITEVNIKVRHADTFWI